MIKLSPKDASVLARIAQYLQLPEEQRKQMLADIDDEDARRVGAILLGEVSSESPDISPDIRETAEELRSWSTMSRAATSRRSSRK